jgi:hypothetical protein
MEAEPEITKPKKASPCETQKAFLALVRIFTLATLVLVLCSCADSYEILGLHLKRAADDDRDNAGHGYFPGAGDPGN